MSDKKDCIWRISKIIRWIRLDIVTDKDKESRKSELFNINEEIKKIYNEIEEVDNNIKDKKDQIKKMEAEIREVKDAAASFMSAFKYITFVSKNSILNRFKNIFKKDQLKLAETNNN